MAARNYQPTLRRLMKVLALFVTRYRTLIDAGLDPAEAAQLAVLAAALDDMIALLGSGGGV